MTEVLKRGTPGLKSVKDLPIAQDVPPPGGFPGIRIDRRLPTTGPTGVTLFFTATAVMAYGFYKIWETVKERRLDRAELMAVREAICPVLQAETDARYVAIRKRQLEEEARIMANVPGWKVGGDQHRWIPPPDPKGIWNPLLQ